MKTERLSLGLALLLAACATQLAVREVAPPMALETSAYEAAGVVELPEVEPEELPGLHNVYRLSDNIVSGAEPEGVEAFETLRELGIRTILTVDGKEPDHQLAAEYGLRYVHVPIRYDGIQHEELVAITKTFRELEGPFYVHCYHGQHRGPAAAAVGRLVLDGAPREQVIAEMRQWCGTSKKYEGLYRVGAAGLLPSEAETAASDFDFAPAFRFAGLRGAMVELTRSFDTVEDLMFRDWGVNPDHPDASALNEAAKMAEAYQQSLDFEGRTEFFGEGVAYPEDFRTWLAESRDAAAKLAEYLRAFEAGDAAAGELAAEQVDVISANCSACHAGYRNAR